MAALVAAFISFEITRDGLSSLRRVVRDLTDGAPTHVDDDQLHELDEQSSSALRALAWVVEVKLRKREEGHVFVGEAFIVPSDELEPLQRLEQATRVGRATNTRIYDLVTLVRELPEQLGPRLGMPS